jgi:hypothetical protein
MTPTMHERLATVEAKLTTLGETVDATAGDVREIRDYMISTRSSASARWKTLTILGALVMGIASLGAGFNALVNVLFPPHHP